MQVCKLFFAIGISDSRMQEIEQAMVIKAIKDYCDLRKKDAQLVDNSTGAIEEDIFRAISIKDPNAWELFKDFEDYYINNKVEFSEKAKQWITATANGIGSSFSGKNKSELVMLARLSLLFKQV